MTEKEFQAGGAGSEQERLDKLQELIALFEDFPEEGVPVTTDASEHWPPQYNNLQNYDRVATSVMRALQYMDSIAPDLQSPSFADRIKKMGEEFYVRTDPQSSKTPRTVYKSEDIARLRTLLVDLANYISSES